MEKDVVLVAFPSENRVEVEANSADGMVATKSVTGSSMKHSITGDEVNGLLNVLRERKLTYAFKLPPDE